MLSSLLRVYRTYFAKFLIFRLFKALALTTYRNAYRLRSALSVLPNISTYKLVSWSYFNDLPLLRRISFIPNQSIDIPVPRFANNLTSMQQEKIGTLKIKMPKLEVAEISEATVVGGTDFVLTGKAAIFPEAFISSQDTCPAEVFGVASIDHNVGLMKLYLTRKPKKINFGATLLGQSTTNYAHWLTETLPKLAILDIFPEFDSAPLLLDYGLHPNLYESVNVLNTKHRKIIIVKRWEPANVNKLVSVSQPGYEPYTPHGLSGNCSPRIVNAFSRSALHLLRDAACQATRNSALLGAKKVYISRSIKSGNIRRVLNSDAIENFVRMKGFDVIEPSTMTFSKQVTACKQADVIIAPIGAALANMIFSPSGCKVIALAPYYEGASYYYYSNLAGVVGHELYYVLGRQIHNDGHPMHRDYFIDLSDLEMMLDSVLRGDP